MGSGGYGGPPNYGVGGYGTGGGAPGVIPSLDYYLNQLSSQYQTAPNFNAFLAACCQPFIDAAMLMQSMVNAFDINAAIGVQLDVIGQIVGAPRLVPFQPSNGVSPILTDSVYRILLKAKVAQNQWNGQIDSLYPIWADLFSGGQIQVVDGQNMTAAITLSGTFSSITQDLINNGLIVPRPEGVEYFYSFAALPIFGFDLENAFIAGWDVGKWA